MTTPSLRTLVAPGIEHLLPPFFDRDLVVEEHATCDDCPMCEPAGGDSLPGSVYFRPEVVCCTYHPDVPNYLVGAVLTDTVASWNEARRRLRAEIEGRRAISPLAIQAPAKDRLLYAHTAQGFGRSSALRCPYLASEPCRCSLWPWRTAPCSTWFCKYVHGKQSLRFWAAMRAYLTEVQFALSAHAVLVQGLDLVALEGALRGSDDLTSEDLDEQPVSDARYHLLWGNWLGREEAFYQAAWERVRALDPTDLQRLGGIRLQALQHSLEQAHAKMLDPSVPLRLRRNPDLVVHPHAYGRRLVAAFSPNDPVLVSARLYRLLEHFDGRRPVAEVQEDLRREEGWRLTEGLLRRLYEHDVLLDAGEG